MGREELIVQVSLYPLGIEDPIPVIDLVIRKWQELGLDPIPGPMSTLISGEEGKVWEALRAAFSSIPPTCDPVMIIAMRRKKT